MKHKAFLFSSIFLLGSIVISCGSNNNKEDRSTTNTDTTISTPAPAAAESLKKESESRNPDTIDHASEKDKILANIDQYLISKPDISTAVLAVENTLKDAIIIKAYAEVSVLDANDKVLRTNFLILENIKPGDSKSVRIPNTSGGVKVVSHIVRLKSDELTNGEAILVGSRYIPK